MPRASRLSATWRSPAGTNPGATITLRYSGQEYQRTVGAEDWVTQREAALLLGISVMAVNKNVRARKLKAAVHDGVSVIQLNEVARFAGARGITPEAGRPLPWLRQLVHRLAPPLTDPDEASTWQEVTLQERARTRYSSKRQRRASQRRRARRPRHR